MIIDFQAHDPMMFEVGGTYAPKSLFQRLDRQIGRLYEAIDFRVEKFSRAKADALQTQFQWYTPICLLRTANGKLFVYKRLVFFIRNPFKYRELVKQFRLGGHQDTTDGVWLDIIETDSEFDATVSACIGLGLSVVIDPSIDRDGQLRKGTYIEAMPLDDKDVEALIDQFD